MLLRHFDQMDARAAELGAEIAQDPLIFSLTADCSVAMPADYFTKRVANLKEHLGISDKRPETIALEDEALGDRHGLDRFDGSIVALRKFSSSELLDAGFNVRVAADRQGHSPDTLLKHYAKRRDSADVKAAEHLGRIVHRTRPQC